MNDAAPARLLIVEDELIVAADIASRLTRLGYEVAGQADTPQDAVRLAGELRPDLVLMDIRLRGNGDGVDATGEIQTRYHLPVVFLTAHADEVTLQRAKRTGAFGYVLKPFEERELRTAVEMALFKHAAERRLALSERRYATTLASIGDGVVATDAGGRVTFLNPVAERLTGWPLAEAAGRPLSEVFRIIDERTRAPVEDPVQKVLQTGAVVGLANHTVLQGRGGREVPIDDCAAPILDDEGALSGVVLVFRDVSEERRREEVLRQAQKMEAVGQLAGGIAHDFNNLLTVLNGYCSLVREGLEADSPWQGPLEEMARTGQRAADLTRQLLAFARKQLVQPRALDLGQVVSASATMLRRLIPATVELRVELDPRPATILADPGQLEQVVLNLVLNARDAMPGGGRILLRSALDAERVTLSVEDDGQGMPPEVLARVWEPFFTTKELGRGTGLGLATVYGIVQQAGGQVEVESQLGRGTTFIVAFPRVSDAPAPPRPAPASDLPTGDETVLLVEDDESVRSLVSRVLRSIGYVVLEANSGVQALETADRATQPIHLLVTDLSMPQMSGQTLATLFRARFPATRVMFMTGYSEREVADRAATVLTKPFAISTLATTIREVLDAGGS
ncbi:MAG: response regulator [Planctomycetota bacterium]